LCSREKPYKAFIYAMLGDLEYYAAHLQMPYSGDNHFCWLCTCDRGEGENAFNNFTEDLDRVPLGFCLFLTGYGVF